jgi:uncharacterized protein (TIGR03118 family)
MLESRALMSQVHALAAHHHGKSHLVQTNLVSDGNSASHTDPKLVNPWGIADSSTSPFWLSDNGTGVSTLYNGSGTPSSLVVTIPTPPGDANAAAPTGIVFNSTTDFVVSSGGKTGVSAFVFATEDGTISGWSPKVDGTHAILAVDNSSTSAVYKGLALASSTSGNRLYATNFRSGTVDVFDANFKPVALSSGAFHDSHIPAGFAPFGITNLGGDLLVTFAKQDGAKHDDVPGKGNGFVDLFDPNGNLIARVAKRGTLNSPWGLVVAPSSFGTFAGDLLVGDFGDGRINAYHLVGNTAKFVGQVTKPSGKPLHIDGLWGLEFGNGAMAGSTNTLFFTAGPDGEQHGLFGSLTVG